MSWIRRFGNVFRQNRIDREIDEELASHFEDAVEQGCSEDEARRTLGSPLRYREQSRDIKLLPWLESITADIVFGWRQLNKHRAVSAAAILSLALATGATTGAFRLVNAVLWFGRVSHSGKRTRLFDHARQGESDAERSDDNGRRASHGERRRDWVRGLTRQL